MSNATEPTLQKSDAEFLWGFWYPAARSPEVRGRELAKARLLGVPLVLGRDAAGRVFALLDACPHRAMPLSYGHFDGETLECCYHGWRFEPHSGQCREIPSLTPDSKLKVERIFAASYPCEEQDGYVWVFMSEAAARREPSDAPPAPRLPVFSKRYRLTHLAAELPCSVDHGIIGLMDPAHGPFVHQSWWWRSRRSIHEKEKTFEPLPLGFRIRAHTPSRNSAPYRLLGLTGHEVTTQIDFVLPNLRFEEIHCGPYWFSSRATVTPLERNRCRIDFCAAWNLLAWVPFVVPVFRAFGRRFIEQDRRTMEEQAEGLRHAPAMMLVDDADRPAKWYFQLKQAYLESHRNGRPMQHPLNGPVTLRWRS
jgi:phenylpropionate dioxygenase-like ring-hydroxylating dioxygenase large terminal subunit